MVFFITSNKFYYRRQEIWFYNNEPLQLLNNNLFYQSPVKPTHTVSNLKEFSTLITPLTLTEDELMARIKTKVRWEIKQAPKQNITFHVKKEVSEKELSNYINTYNNFARQKGLGEITMASAFAAMKKKCLCITIAQLEEKPLVIHFYILNNNERARLQLSFHDITLPEEMNQVRGNANRFLHWSDLLYFKQNNFRVYDWGGVDLKTENHITKFKMGFGGDIEYSFDYSIETGLYRLYKKTKA
jgi:hypothetical protein